MGPQQLDSSTQEVVHFALEGLLPPTEILAVHLMLRTLSRLEHDQHPSHPLHPLILAEQQFTRREFNLLYLLLNSYPNYTPYEILYASFNYGGYVRGLTGQAIARARARLAEARTHGSLRFETHAIGDALCGARPKLRALGLDYVILWETGYELDKYRRRA